MLASIGLIVLGLLALNCAIDARNLGLKESEQNFVSSQITRSTTSLKSLLRKRRNVDSSSSSESSDEGQLKKFFFTKAWKDNKEDTLASFLEEMADFDSNLTVVGWQRILNADGTIKQIRALELVIPPKPSRDPCQEIKALEDNSEEEERAIPLLNIEEMKEIFAPMAALGVPASATFEEFEKDGTRSTMIYLDTDELYVKSDNFTIYNKTIIATNEEVEAWIANIKKTKQTLEPTIVRYDSNGKLKSNSEVKPLLWGNVIDFDEDISDDVLQQAPAIMAQIAFSYGKEDIAKQLALKFNTNFPKLKWRVLVDAVNPWVKKDASITLSYDNLDLDEDSDISYYVYGVNKTI